MSSCLKKSVASGAELSPLAGEQLLYKQALGLPATRLGQLDHAADCAAVATCAGVSAAGTHLQIFLLESLKLHPELTVGRLQSTVIFRQPLNLPLLLPDGFLHVQDNMAAAASPQHTTDMHVRNCFASPAAGGCGSCSPDATCASNTGAATAALLAQRMLLIAHRQLPLLLPAMALCCQCCVLPTQLIKVVPQAGELLPLVQQLVILALDYITTALQPAEMQMHTTVVYFRGLKQQLL